MDENDYVKMKAGIILSISLLFLVGLMDSVLAISQSDFQNVVLNDNRGSIDDASGGHVTYKMGKGGMESCSIKVYYGIFWSILE